MNDAMEWDKRDGVLDEWAGWFRDLPPLLPVAIGCAGALIGSALTFSEVPEGVSGFVALTVMIFLGWGAHLGVLAWLAQRETLLTTYLLLKSVGMIQAYNAILVLPRTWGSLQMAALVIAVVPLAGALFIVLPVVMRKIVLLLLLVFHFVGIGCAVTAMDVAGQAAPWIPSYLWATIYRPYLQFLYMNNAYHFYSPEPGPATLLWFRIDYENGASRWYKIPNLDAGQVSLLFFRELSLAELGANQAMPYQPGNFNELIHQRNIAGMNSIPKIPALPLELAAHNVYRQPVPKTIDNLASYARHVAKKFPHPKDNPEGKVSKIRIYRVTHTIIGPGQLASGKDPKDPSTYLPYFYGDYNSDGKLIDPNDPFLYFSFPIYDPNDKYIRSAGFDSETVLDYFKLHSGLDLAEEKQ